MHDMEEMIAVDSMQQELDDLRMRRTTIFRRRTHERRERRAEEVGTRVNLALAEIARVNGLTVPELMEI